MKRKLFAIKVIIVVTALFNNVVANMHTGILGYPNPSHLSEISIQLPDSLNPPLILGKELGKKSVDSTATLNSDTTSLSAEDSERYRTNEIIQNRSILEILSVSSDKKIFKWRLNSRYLDYEPIEVDTSLFLNHLFYPQQKKFESYTSLGNIGAPSIEDHFFSRDNSRAFLLSRNYYSYNNKVEQVNQYNVRSPFTSLLYTSAGKRSEAEQLFSVLHTQNVNKHINFGISYNHFGTRGVYENQQTRNNLISLFGSYHKGNLFGQFSFVNNVYNNEENGGIKYSELIPGDTLETKLIPVWLENAKSTTRERSISALMGYTFINIKEVKLPSDTIDKYIPLISAKLQITREMHSRTFENTGTTDDYFEYDLITSGSVYDSIAMVQYDAKAILEINQFANITGMPGLRGWIGYTDSRYHMLKPDNFIYDTGNKELNSAHFGLAAFSKNPYLSYRGAARVYFSGDKADDKELSGDVRISFWKDPEMPQLKGNVLLSEVTPDFFYRSYFSNHYSWENQFDKEKRFKLGASFDINKWNTELGYNVVYINDFLYFNEDSEPAQASDVTVTSAFVQNNLKFFNGFNFFNRVVWQANTNRDVLSLPTIMVFSTLFYETVLVPGALTGQFGINMTYRSEFYADAYNPVTAQFFNQRQVKLGNYPVVDVYANFKWKSAIIFVKYDHLNQGFSSNRYYSAFSHPMNPRIFKFGVSWIFYD